VIWEPDNLCIQRPAQITLIPNQYRLCARLSQNHKMGKQYIIGNA